MSKAITEYLNKDPQLIQLKKSETILVICGNGVIFFGVWSLIKSIMSIVIYKGDLYQYLVQYQNAHLLRGLAYGSVIFVLAMDLFFRFYLGMSASAEAKGKKKKKGYLFLAFFMLFYTVLGLVATLFLLPDDISLLTTMTTILVEFTSALTLLQMIISAIRVREIRKSVYPERKEGETEG